MFGAQTLPWRTWFRRVRPRRRPSPQLVPCITASATAGMATKLAVGNVPLSDTATGSTMSGAGWASGQC